MRSQISHMRLEDAAPYRTQSRFAAAPGFPAEHAAPGLKPRTLLGLGARTPILIQGEKQLPLHRQRFDAA